jgi:DNA-binding response OmpR family regulator
MSGKEILIVDEEGFSRVCSAILEREGYTTKTISDFQEAPSRVNCTDFGLIITSFPYGRFFYEAIKEKGIPAIILSDHINKELIATLEGFNSSHSYCMIKPLDYEKFRILVRELMSGDGNPCRGYNIV